MNESYGFNPRISSFVYRGPQSWPNLPRAVFQAQVASRSGEFVCFEPTTDGVRIFFCFFRVSFLLGGGKNYNVNPGLVNS